MRLVIAEKPSVAVDLAKVMDPTAKRGDGCVVGQYATWTWALGHLVELAPPEHYQPALKGKWDLGLLPILPEHYALQPREGRSQQLGVIQRLLRQAETVIVATDAGREGELIWEYIAEAGGYQGPVERLWLSESTPAAVQAAFGALRPPMTNLAAAARARSVADWVVGMNATMALSARHGGLWSAGRVQTPTLALLCRREAEIQAFRPTDYFVVLADFDAGGKYAGRWFRADADRLASRAEAEAVAARVRGQAGTVAKVEHKRTQEAPPRLFNLTDLQRAANARYGMTAAATLAAAQALYEKHKALSYPRTDSRHVSAETAATFPARLQAVAHANLPDPLGPIAQRLAGNVPDPGKRVIDGAKVSDHHALLPTTQAPDPASLTEDERQVQGLVVCRFLAALLPSAVYDDTEAITEVQGETFRSRSRVLAVPGWREVEPGTAKGQAGEDQEEQSDLSGLQQGVPSRCVDARADARRTKPPTRYSEATLLAAMEHAGRLVDDEGLADAMRERGLGTPATRAAIIEVLVKRGFVERKGKTVLSTPAGRILVAALPPALTDPGVTGLWEDALADVAAGTRTLDAFEQQQRAFVVKRVEAAKAGAALAMPSQPAAKPKRTARKKAK